MFFCFAYCPAILFIFEMQKVFERFGQRDKLFYLLFFYHLWIFYLIISLNLEFRSNCSIYDVFFLFRFVIPCMSDFIGVSCQRDTKIGGEREYF
jgi:hypothetical protein